MIHPPGQLLLGVDLRALEATGVVDVDRLPLREDVEGGLARLAVAVARVLRAAERQVHLPFGGTKDTGNGHREAGQAALDVFTEWKSIYVDYSGRLQRAQIDTEQ